jgi:UDP-N-acetylmuramoylalanine--D-glutamate ligase
MRFGAEVLQLSRSSFTRVERPGLPEGDALVVGLGVSGQSAAKLLCALGRRVIAVDNCSPPGSDTLGDFGAEVHLNTDGSEFVDQVELVVKSPGVPQEAPAIAAARAAGKPVIGELELGWRLLPNPFIAVTGTNGKTTTVELLRQIYADAGLPVALAGNVGTPVCDLVENVSHDATIVCEASSFQLEDSPEFTPECGVLLNIAPDHLDRHHTFNDYRDAKLTMFAGQQEGQFAVIGPSVEGEIPGAARKYRVPAADLAQIGDSIALQGPHNKENALIATQAAMLMGVDPLSISRTLASFAGLPHRMQLIGANNGVAFINDSKATNVAATRAALEGFASNAHLLLGGSPKGEDYSPLKSAIEQGCAAVYINGANAEELQTALKDLKTPISSYETLDQAFAAATAAAKPGETVLLSSAAASFDQFANYGDRGQRFCDLFAALAA